MAKVNRNYGKLDSQGAITFAPVAFRMNGVDYWHPTAADYRIVGYLPVADNPAPSDAPVGKHYEPTGTYAISPDGQSVTAQYALVDDPPPPPRVFVTADLVEALMAEGIWTDVRSWIETQGLLDLVLATTEFDENNENFKAGRAALQTALGWTDEDVEELLAKCVKEGA